MPTTTKVVRAVGVQTALQVFQDFEQLKNEVTNPEVDIVQISGQPYYNKYFWNKMAVLFNLSKEIIAQDEEVSDKGVRIVKVKVRVTAPNGRFSEAISVATSNEQWARGKSLSAYIGMATTRASNRCIQDLVAPGSLSAEEITDGGSGNTEHRTQRPNFTRFFKEATSKKDISEVKEEVKREYGHQLKDCSQEELDQYLEKLKRKDEVIF